MKDNAFTEKSPGKLVPIPNGLKAFVPDSIPRQMDFTPSIYHLLSDAMYNVGELNTMTSMLPNPHLLVGPFLRREAVLSSQIEGTIASLEELFIFEADPKKTEKSDVHEVRNYVSAMKFALDKLKVKPLCLSLIEEMHGILMQGVRGQDKRPGEFRKTQNAIGQYGLPATDARFIPPPYPTTIQLLDDLEKFINKVEGHTIPTLIEIALIHYQFETIHPFCDGNGRIGRLLINLLFCERKLLSSPLLYLSAFFVKHKSEYQDHLLRVSEQGLWENWINFFLLAVKEQAKDAVKRAKKLLDLWEIYRERLQQRKGYSTTALQLVDKLFEWPAITTPIARKVLNLNTSRGALLNIKKLVHENILHEVNRKGKTRVFLAPEIIGIVEAENI